jgi:hypothetical protein
MNDPDNYAAAYEIDIATALSQKLGRTIKQGNNFRLVGYGAFLTGGTGGDVDMGMSAVVRAQFCPTTYHSASAWRKMAGNYNKQSQFRAGLGGKTKYDEFEVAHHGGGADSRTSTVYVGGITDPDPEVVCIYGDYDADGADRQIGLDTYYDALNPVDAGGTLVETDLLFDDTVDYKPAKFSSKFPRASHLGMTATHSASLFYDHDIGLDEIYDMQGISMDTMHYLPSDNHLNIMCGRMAIRAHALPRDDENIWADTLKLWVVMDFEGWSSLWNKPQKRGKKRGRKGRK